MKRWAMVVALAACAQAASGQEPASGTAPSFSPVTWSGCSTPRTSPTTG